MNRTPPSTADTTAALKALRDRYRASSAKIVAAFRYLAAQLTVGPNAPQVLETLRRELHRVHGTAGTYGYPEVSQLAGVLEARAARWSAEPSFDEGRRAMIIAHFASALEARVCGTAAPPPMPGASVAAPSVTVAQSAARPASVPSPPVPQASAVPDVIIVEDDPSLADMFSYALTTTGYSFRHFQTGPAALEALLALDTQGRRPVILLDVDLPGLDGISLHERLRTERPGAFAIVFVTVHGAEAEQIRAYRSGAMDYLVKPVNLRVLMAKLPSWVERAGAGAGKASA